MPSPEFSDYLKQHEATIAEIVAHGYGRVDIDVSSLKDGKIKITLCAGKTYVFFVEKDLPLDKNKNII
jgi:hypothetical protein